MSKQNTLVLIAWVDFARRLSRFACAEECCFLFPFQFFALYVNREYVHGVNTTRGVRQ